MDNKNAHVCPETAHSAIMRIDQHRPVGGLALSAATGASLGVIKEVVKIAYMRKSPVSGAVDFSVFFVCLTNSVDGIFKPTVIIVILIGVDHKVVADRCKEVVVISGGCFFAEFLPKIAASCSYERLVATSQLAKGEDDVADSN